VIRPTAKIKLMMAGCGLGKGSPSVIFVLKLAVDEEASSGAAPLV
jgi:hypothetical protein